MALKIRPTNPPPTPTKKYPDAELFLEQNADGSVDVVTSGIPGVLDSRTIRFFDDGSIARIRKQGLSGRAFHKDDGTGRVVID
jgi:hypothetical protein